MNEKECNTWILLLTIACVICDCSLLVSFLTMYLLFSLSIGKSITDYVFNIDNKQISEKTISVIILLYITGVIMLNYTIELLLNYE